LIFQAQTELNLIPKMAQWKPWEPNPTSIPEEQFAPPK